MFRKMALLGFVTLVMFVSSSFAFQRCIWNGDYVEMSGKVEDVSPPVAFVVSEGTRYVLRLGPYWFWTERNYTLTRGEEVEIKGWKCGEMVLPKEIVKADGTVLSFRDENGIPLWRRGMGCGCMTR